MFDFFPEDKQKTIDWAKSPTPPSFFTGFGSEIAHGVARGVSGTLKAGRIGLVGPAAMALDKAMGTDKEYQDFVFRKAQELDFAGEYTPRPGTVGTAGRIVGGVAESMVPLIFGPETFVGATGLRSGVELTEQGVSPGAAALIATQQSAFAGIGFKIPFLGDTLSKKVLFGALSNPLVGASSDLASKGILRAAGEDAAAKKFDPLNVEARAVELLMGAAFGGIAHLSEPMKETLRPSDKDAILTANNAKHFEVDAAPGKPADGLSAKAHIEALETAITQLARGEPVDVAGRMQDANFLKNDWVDRERVQTQEQTKAVVQELPAEKVEYTDTNIQKLAPDQQSKLVQMYGEARALKPEFDSTLSDIARETGGEAKLPKIKGTERAVAKILTDYKGTASRAKDLLRGTVVSDLPNVQKAIDLVQQRFKVLPDGRNLLTPESPSLDGYRDAKFNVDINGHIAEVQVNIPEMIAAKKQLHPLYVEKESIYRKADLENRPRLTSRERATVDDLKSRMKSGYDAAWERATNSSNASLEIGVPLRSAELTSNLRGGATSQAEQMKGAPGASNETGTPSTSRKSGISSTSGESIPPIEPKVDPQVKADEAAVSAAAQQSIRENPDMMIPDENGNLVSASEAIAKADADIVRAQQDARAFEAAANCLLSR